MALDPCVLLKNNQEIGVREPDPKTGQLERFAKPLLWALVLVFIGSKAVRVGIIGKIPAGISLSETFRLIAGGVPVSRWKTRGQPATDGAT